MVKPAIPALAVAVAALWLTVSSVVQAAPAAITAVGTSAQTGSSTVRSVNGNDPATTTWTGDRTQLDSITVGSQAYIPDVEGQVVVRRNTASTTFPGTNANQVSTWTYRISESPPNVSVYGEYINSFDTLLSANNLQGGIENAFANTGVAEFSLNVERIDFVFDSPVTVTADHQFAIFERGGGGAGSNNGFGMAVITGINITTPTAFSNPYFTADTVFSGSPAILPSDDYDVYKYEFDGGPELDFRHESVTQHLVGVAVPATDLITAGTEIYGYSLFAQDVTATLGSQLVDFDNPTFFPTTTNGDDGDMDMSAIGARIYTVPEPSSALLVVSGLSWLACRRKRDV